MDKRFLIPYSEPRWWWEGTYIPACFECIHFRGAQNGKIVCLAFPDGIPPELTKKGIIHNKPYSGDHGIQFKQYIEN